jgi:hypothetical protein
MAYSESTSFNRNLKSINYGSLAPRTKKELHRNNRSSGIADVITRDKSRNLEPHSQLTELHSRHRSSSNDRNVHHHIFERLLSFFKKSATDAGHNDEEWEIESDLSSVYVKLNPLTESNVVSNMNSIDDIVDRIEIDSDDDLPAAPDVETSKQFDSESFFDVAYDFYNTQAFESTEPIKAWESSYDINISHNEKTIVDNGVAAEKGMNSSSKQLTV